MNDKNEALEAEKKHISATEEAEDYLEHFDILETITNVGNDEVFTPRRTVDKILSSLPDEVWTNSSYKWLNPATKNGIFEREIALRLDKGLEKEIPDVEKRRKHILQNMIFSLGQTKFTSLVSRRTLYYCSDANRSCDGIKAPDGHYVNGYAIGNGTWFSDKEGNIKTPNVEHYIDSKTHKCKYCGVGEDSKYLNKDQSEQYAYEFIHCDGDKLLEHLQDRFFKGDRNMKFDIIIGNPPYQLTTGGGSAQAIPIYNKFVEQAIVLNPKYLCMIIPSRWFAGGMGLDGFRDKMLKDKHLEKIVDFVNAKDCFPNNSIGGGVCYFLWNREKNEKRCEFVNATKEKSNSSFRILDEFPTLIRDNEGVDILRKVRKKSSKFLSENVFSLDAFGLPSKIRGTKEKVNDTDIHVFTSEGFSYIPVSEVIKGRDYVDKYKVILSKTSAEHAGEPGGGGKYNVLTSTMRVLEPREVCNFSYFIVSIFKNEEEAKNLLKYLQTTFVRILILQALSSINLSKQSFQYVPLEDFTRLSDINWELPINEINKQLFKKYDLSKEDIDFIASKINPFVGDTF